MRKILIAAALLFGLSAPAWAQQTIDALGAGATLTGAELVPMFQTANPAVTTTTGAIAALNTGCTLGATTPGQVLYNAAGACGSIAGSSWDGTSFALTTAATSGPLGGNITLTSGDNSDASPGGQAGLIFIVGGTQTTTGRGGSIFLEGGPNAAGIGGGDIALEGGTTTSGTGGGVGILGGPSSSGVGGAAALGGGFSSGGGGGAASLTAGADTAAGAGGNLYIAAGGSVSGTPGNIYLGVDPLVTPIAPFPTTDPASAGAIYSNAGVVTLSGSTSNVFLGSITTHVRTAISATDTISATTDYYICPLNTSGPATEALPASPANGLTFAIKDCGGNAGTNSITITPASGTIDGASSYVISGTAYAGVSVTYTGLQWSIGP